MNNEITNSKLIEEVVKSFYAKAINDILIGYHFRKISSSSGKLVQDINDFEDHLPKIYDFWKTQFGIKTDKPDANTHLFSTHDPLNIRMGEIGRWMMIFNETLNSYEVDNIEFVAEWRRKLLTFEKSFKKRYSNKG